MTLASATEKMKLKMYKANFDTVCFPKLCQFFSIITHKGQKCISFKNQAKEKLLLLLNYILTYSLIVLVFFRNKFS